MEALRLVGLSLTAFPDVCFEFILFFPLLCRQGQAIKNESLCSKMSHTVAYTAATIKARERSRERCAGCEDRGCAVWFFAEMS